MDRREKVCSLLVRKERIADFGWGGGGEEGRVDGMQNFQQENHEINKIFSMDFNL